MWLFDILLNGRGHGVDELARRLDMTAEELTGFRPTYRQFSIAKRRGGRRTIHAPDPETKRLQRRVLRRLLKKLRAHPAATGFERGQSIVDNALPHVQAGVVLNLDIVNFFDSTTASRVRRYFRKIGWNRPAAKILTRLCTHDGCLPQGAPTSPRLSNLVNYRLDARIDGLAASMDGEYTRYADDITVSFAEPLGPVAGVRASIIEILRAGGYRVHHRRKARIRRRHQQQLVTGLVVNEGVRLPRKTRRWLRAVEHRAKQDWRNRPLGEGKFVSAKEPTLTDQQLAGWRSLVKMIEKQTNRPA